jgi:hypothetical protein
MKSRCTLTVTKYQGPLIDKTSIALMLVVLALVTRSRCISQHLALKFRQSVVVSAVTKLLTDGVSADVLRKMYLPILVALTVTIGMFTVGRSKSASNRKEDKKT